MSSPPTNASGWQDRRGMFQGGKAVHEPAKGPFVPKTVAPASPTSPTSTGSTAERRRSSASGTAGMFSNLHSQKRGSTDYDARKQSWSEMSPKGAFGSFFDKVVKK